MHAWTANCGRKGRGCCHAEGCDGLWLLLSGRALHGWCGRLRMLYVHAVMQAQCRCDEDESAAAAVRMAVDATGAILGSMCIILRDAETVGKHRRRKPSPERARASPVSAAPSLHSLYLHTALMEACSSLHSNHATQRVSFSTPTPSCFQIAHALALNLCRDRSGGSQGLATRHCGIRSAALQVSRRHGRARAISALERSLDRGTVDAVPLVRGRGEALRAVQDTGGERLIDRRGAGGARPHAGHKVPCNIAACE